VAYTHQYAIRFAAMTASQLTPKRAVLFDGFAGRGRFDDGSPGCSTLASRAHIKVAHLT